MRLAADGRIIRHQRQNPGGLANNSAKLEASRSGIATWSRPLRGEKSDAAACEVNLNGMMRLYCQRATTSRGSLRLRADGACGLYTMVLIIPITNEQISRIGLAQGLCAVRGCNYFQENVCLRGLFGGAAWQFSYTACSLI